MPTSRLPELPPRGRISKENRALLRLARKASLQAYAPISGLHVGAVIRSQRGGEYIGFNIEVRSLSGTIHAEESALVSAMLREGRRLRVATLAVFGWREEGGVGRPAYESTPPCGNCRQSLYEFGPTATVVFPYESRIEETSMDLLLPSPFITAGDSSSGTPTR